MLPGWLIEILLLVKIIAKIIDKQQNRFCFSELKKNNLLLKVKLRLHEANDQSKKKAVAILPSTAIYPQRLFCRELFVIGQS